jgi:hypothetical protein
VIGEAHAATGSPRPQPRRHTSATSCDRRAPFRTYFAPPAKRHTDAAHVAEVTFQSWAGHIHHTACASTGGGRCHYRHAVRNDRNPAHLRSLNPADRAANGKQSIPPGRRRDGEPPQTTIRSCNEVLETGFSVTMEIGVPRGSSWRSSVSPGSHMEQTSSPPWRPRHSSKPRPVRDNSSTANPSPTSVKYQTIRPSTKRTRLRCS